MKEKLDLVRAWRAMAPGAEAVLATVVATRGSVYRRPGARMLLTREGWIAGSVSGGCVESDLVTTAFDRTEKGAVVVTYDASAPDDILLGFGLGCNGVVDVLMQRLPEDGGPLAAIEQSILERVPVRIETRLDRQSGVLLAEEILPPPSLVIFGAGHDAVPLVRIAKEVGWHVTVVDGRASYARPDRFPTADAVYVSAPSAPYPIEEGASVVLMTHSFAHDSAVLKWLINAGAGYVGVLGPIHRTERILDELGFHRETLFAPIGLDIGAEGPDEIALAIVAEITAVRSGRSGGFLKGRTAPLHAR